MTIEHTMNAINKYTKAMKKIRRSEALSLDEIKRSELEYINRIIKLAENAKNINSNRYSKLDDSHPFDDEPENLSVTFKVDTEEEIVKQQTHIKMRLNREQYIPEDIEAHIDNIEHLEGMGYVKYPTKEEKEKWMEAEAHRLSVLLYASENNFIGMPTLFAEFETFFMPLPEFIEYVLENYPNIVKKKYDKGLELKKFKKMDY